MGYIDDPEASNAVPVSSFYAHCISFLVVGDIRGVVDPQHDLVITVYVRQFLGEGS
jgi:hypothetical protein